MKAIGVKIKAIQAAFRSLWYICASRFRLTRTSLREDMIFFLGLVPPLNLTFAKLFSASSKRKGRLIKFFLNREIGYGSLRHLTPSQRDRIAGKLHGDPSASVNLSAHLEAKLAVLRRDGFVSLGRMFSEDDCRAFAHHLSAEPAFLSQVATQAPARTTTVEKAIATGARYLCFHPDSSLRFDRFKAFVHKEDLLELAAAYLGRKPNLYSVNTFYTAPGEGTHYVMRMHRDYDDFSALTFFVAWTPTAGDNGATIFMKGSHARDTGEFEKVYLSAAPGEVFAVDTFGLHAGNANVRHLRLATWFRFGSPSNLATINNPESHLKKLNEIPHQ